MTHPLSPLALGYSVLAGPIVWFVHFATVYGVAEFGCRANFTNMIFISPANIRIVITVLTILAFAAVGFGGVLAYRSWQTLNQNEANETLTEARYRFLVILGMLLSALFLLSILFTVAPTFFLSVCDRAT